MDITLYSAKNDGSLAPIEEYDMAEDEANRLIADWRSFIENDSPKTGSYQYTKYQYAGKEGEKTLQPIVVKFEIIAHIG